MELTHILAVDECTLVLFVQSAEFCDFVPFSSKTNLSTRHPSASNQMSIRFSVSDHTTAKVLKLLNGLAGWPVFWRSQRTSRHSTLLDQCSTAFDDRPSRQTSTAACRTSRWPSVADDSTVPRHRLRHSTWRPRRRDDVPTCPTYWRHSTISDCSRHPAAAAATAWYKTDRRCESQWLGWPDHWYSLLSDIDDHWTSSSSYCFRLQHNTDVGLFSNIHCVQN